MVYTKECSKMMKGMGTESSNTKRVKYMKDNGKTT